MCDVKVAPAKALGTKPKEKRRNSEKRKVKSRDAARCRRGRESEIFTDLGSHLPMAQSTLSRLDKASIMRLSISYVKIRNYANSIADSLKNVVMTKQDLICLNAMGGFLLVLSEDGDMVYLSENVAKFLGLTQIDLMGQSIFDYSHPCDHTDIKEMLSLKPLVHPFSYFVRMTCTLSGRGRNVNLKSASFKVIHYTGYVWSNSESSVENDSCSFLVTIGEPVPHPANIEILLDKQTFLSRHSLDMKFTYVDAGIEQVLGYTSEELMTKSIYSFCHALDLICLEKYFKILFSKGQCVTGQYRFLAKYGGYVWILTEATVIYESSPSKPQCVVCINYVISGRENKDEIVSEEQVIPKMTAPVEEPPVPKASTKSIFAPRTADMNTGFLTFADDDSDLTVFKDEPEDLTHLAPQAGDVCVLLPGSAFGSEMFGEEGGLLKEQSKLMNQESLLNEEPSYPTAPQCSPLTNDPFLSYREDPPKESTVAAKDLSEERNREDPFNKHLDDVELNEEEDEFAGRAPYIPMNGNDDILLLTPPDSLLWDSSDDLEVHQHKLSLTDLLQSEVQEARERLTGSPETLRGQLPSSVTALADNQSNCDDSSCVSKISPKRITFHGGGSSGQKRLKMDTRIIAEPGNQSSVLLNLLLNGEDSNYGYLCNASKQNPQYKQMGGALAIQRTSNTRPGSFPRSSGLNLPPLSEM